MKNYNWMFILGIAIIFLWTGVAIADVGETYKSTPNPWWIPLEIFLLFSVVMMVGFLAGKKDCENNYKN